MSANRWLRSNRLCVFGIFAEVAPKCLCPGVRLHAVLTLQTRAILHGAVALPSRAILLDAVLLPVLVIFHGGIAMPALFILLDVAVPPFLKHLSVRCA